MNQEKIGKFITQCRKEKHLTQAEVANTLSITDRAVSKWETGKSLPDPSIMLELCDILDINVNELLLGEHVNMEKYKEKAEENLIELTTQEEINNKKLLNLEVVMGVICTIAFLVLVYAACFEVSNIYWKTAMIGIGSVIFVIGMFYSIKLEHDVGYYACPHCGKRYVPSMVSVVFAPHVFRSRYMKCPYCKKGGLHKKVLTK